jgi:hypothetical protein
MVKRKGPQVWLREREKGGRVVDNEGRSSACLTVEKKLLGRNLARRLFRGRRMGHVLKPEAEAHYREVPGVPNGVPVTF